MSHGPNYISGVYISILHRVYIQGLLGSIYGVLTLGHIYLGPQHAFAVVSSTALARPWLEPGGLLKRPRA